MVHAGGFNHGLVCAVFYRLGGCTLDHFRGIGRAMPFTMAGFLLAGFSLIGVPFTAGFISKWWLITALIQIEWWQLEPHLLGQKSPLLLGIG